MAKKKKKEVYAAYSRKYTLWKEQFHWGTKDLKEELKPFGYNAGNVRMIQEILLPFLRRRRIKMQDVENSLACLINSAMLERMADNRPLKLKVRDRDVWFNRGHYYRQRPKARVIDYAKEGRSHPWP